MAQTITITAAESYNPRFAPAGAKKAYLARITGREAQRTFAREFLPRSYTVDAASCPLLLEKVDSDKKGRRHDPEYIIVCAVEEEVLTSEVDHSDAMWLAAQMDAGRALDDCWDCETGQRVSPAAAARQQAGQTVETAIAGCWAQLDQMPEKLQKKVLAALRARISSPKAGTRATSDEAPRDGAESTAG